MCSICWALNVVDLEPVKALDLIKLEQKSVRSTQTQLDESELYMNYPWLKICSLENLDFYSWIKKRQDIISNLI